MLNKRTRIARELQARSVSEPASAVVDPFSRRAHFLINSLKCWHPAEILNRIGTVRIARFFQDFTEDLKAAGLVPPDRIPGEMVDPKGQRISRQGAEGGAGGG